MRKKALLALMLAAALLLSGCALIVKDEAVDKATEILRLGDRVFTKEEVQYQVNYQLEYNAMLYSMYGSSYDVTDPQNIASVQDSVISSFKNRLVVAAKAEELGLAPLTDEEMEKVKADAQESYDTNLEYAKNTILKDSGLEGEELEAAALKEIEKENLTMDKLIEGTAESAVTDKVRQYIYDQVTVSDEEVQAEYDRLVESDQTTYAEDAGSYATAVNNGTSVYYAPAGVRRVKQILTKFKEEDQTAIDDAKSALVDANSAMSAAEEKVKAAQELLDTEGIADDTKANAEADLAAAQEEKDAAGKTVEEATNAVNEATETAFANLDADVDAILASLDEEGADWQAIMEEKNQDPGMEDNEKGYAIAEGMTGFDTAFVDAALALEKVGDHSGKVRGTSNGYYIIRYDSDEPEGAVAFEDVKETISDSLLSQKQTSTYNSTLARWVEEAGIKVDLNALKD